MMKAKKGSPALQKAWKVDKSHPPLLNETGSDELFVTCLNDNSDKKALGCFY